MEFQVGIQDFQSLFQDDIRLVKINSLLKFDDCWEECLGRLDIYYKVFIGQSRIFESSIHLGPRLGFAHMILQNLYCEKSSRRVLSFILIDLTK